MQGILGEGAFAKVLLCRNTKDKKLYAAKVMNFESNRRLKWEAENEIEVIETIQIHLFASSRIAQILTVLHDRLMHTSTPSTHAQLSIVFIIYYTACLYLCSFELNFLWSRGFIVFYYKLNLTAIVFNTRYYRLMLCERMHA